MIQNSLFHTEVVLAITSFCFTLYILFPVFMVQVQVSSTQCGAPSEQEAAAHSWWKTVHCSAATGKYTHSIFSCNLFIHLLYIERHCIYDPESEYFKLQHIWKKMQIKMHFEIKCLLSPKINIILDRFRLFFIQENYQLCFFLKPGVKSFTMTHPPRPKNKRTEKN